MNMKIVLIVFLSLRVILCTQIQLPNINPQLVHIPKVEKEHTAQTIFFLKDNYDDMLINSLLKSLYTSQAVLLVSGEYVSTYEINSYLPNIIVVTRNLETEALGTEAFNTVLFSFWSYVYIVVITRDEKYECGNGTLRKDTYNEVKIYLNKLWHVYKIGRAMVMLPYTCPEHYIIYDGKEQSAPGEYYNRGLKLIRPNNDKDLVKAFAESGRHLTVDYPIRANIFDRFPTSITECDVIDKYTKLSPKRFSPFCGLDGLIMEDFFQYYKYNVYFSTEKGCNFYGYVNAKTNKTTGSLGCIVDHKIDISFNSRFLWHYTTDGYHFLYHVAEDFLCPVMKRPLVVPLWHYATNAYNPALSVAILTVLTFLGFVTWLLAWISSKFTNKKPDKIYAYLMNSVSSALFGIMSQHDKTFLILKGTSLVCSVILLAIYQGHINYQFTTFSHYDQIKTVKQLFESETTLITSPSIMYILKPTVSRNAEFMRRIRILNISNYEHLESVINDPTLTTVSRKNDVMTDLIRNHVNQTMPNVYVLDECFQGLLLSFIASSDFLFVEESTKFMMRLVESGLPDQYYIWTRRAYNLAEHFPSIGPEPRTFQPIDLLTVRSSFIFLLVGYFVSGFVFAVERIKGRKL